MVNNWPVKEEQRILMRQFSVFLQETSLLSGCVRRQNELLEWLRSLWKTLYFHKRDVSRRKRVTLSYKMIARIKVEPITGYRRIYGPF